MSAPVKCGGSGQQVARDTSDDLTGVGVRINECGGCGIRLSLPASGVMPAHYRIVQPWDAEKARQLSAIAGRMFSDHFTGCYKAERWERENCGGCVLGGFGADSDGPNYAGWARVYVEARRVIPAEWLDAFERERASDNRLYAEALERSIATFGVFRMASGIVTHDA